MAIHEKLRWIITSITGKEKTHESAVRDIFLKAHEQFVLGRKLGQSVAINQDIEHLTGVGMGGSMHPMFILQTYLRNIDFRKNVHLVRDYIIPCNISKKGFLFIISYSGNTEETISAYKQAYRSGYHMMVLTSGGKLGELAHGHGTGCINLPKGYSARMSFYIIFGCILQILQNSGIIDNLDNEAAHVETILQKSLFESTGKQLAKKIGKSVPLVYTTPRFDLVNERWKISFNENAKIHAFANVLPELDHNEINAYATKIGPFHAIFLVDEQETEKHRKRIQVTKQLIQEENYQATELVVRGPSYLSRLISAIYIGDWTSYYCAQNVGVDVGPVAIIERLKKML